MSILPKEFALPLIQRPIDTSLKLWISGRAREANSSRIADLSGSKNSGDIIGASWVNTPLNYSRMSFDGVDDFISIPDNDVWDSADFTLIVWTKQNAFAGNYWQRAFIAHNTIGGLNNKWTFAHNGTATEFIFVVSSNVYTLTSDAWTLSAGVWYCIGVTRIGSNFVFYKDGLANGTASSAVALANVAQPLIIGWAEGSPKTYDGIIDEVRIYNRALTADEVKQYYESTKYLFGY